MATPRLVSLAGATHDVWIIPTLRLAGQVRDDRGRALAGVPVFLVTAPPRLGGTVTPVSRRLAETDAAGLYDVRLEPPWPGGSSLVAWYGTLLPGVASISEIDAPMARIDFDLRRGFDWAVQVLDEDGRGLQGVGVACITDSSPVLEGWPTDDVPPGAGGELAIVSRATHTDESGRAVVRDWPPRGVARIAVQGDAVRRFELVSGPDRSTRRQNRLLFEPRDGDAATIVVRVVVRDRIVMRGRLNGFTASETASMRLVRDLGEGARVLASLRIAPDGAFEATWPLASTEDRDRVTLVVFAQVQGSTDRWPLGPYELRGTLEVDGVLVSR